MFEIVYRSKAKENISQEELDSILSSAREFNKKHTITGCLLFHNGYFVQVLEGDKETIENLYAKILSDSRHSDAKIITQGMKEQILFSDWNMAFCNLDSDNLAFDKEMFTSNFITYSDVAAKPTKAAAQFWKEVKELLQAK
jgi:hypothetical protein